MMAEIPWKDIYSRKRDAPTALARHRVMHGLVMEGLTYVKVGEILDRTPATVMHGFMRIAKMKEVAR